VDDDSKVVMPWKQWSVSSLGIDTARDEPAIAVVFSSIEEPKGITKSLFLESYKKEAAPSQAERKEHLSPFVEQLKLHCSADATVHEGPVTDPYGQKLLAAFELYDDDGSGTLSADELLQILMRGDSSITAEDAQEIVEDFDRNGDGVLQLSEFIETITALVPGGLPDQVLEKKPFVGPGGLEPNDVFHSLPEALRTALASQDAAAYLNALGSLPEAEGRKHHERAIGAGLWNTPPPGPGGGDQHETLAFLVPAEVRTALLAGNNSGYIEQLAALPREQAASLHKLCCDAGCWHGQPAGPGGLDPTEVLYSLPAALRAALLAGDAAGYKAALAALPDEEAKGHLQRCIDAGLWK
jgi:hypothetical protein